VIKNTVLSDIMSC